MRQLSQLATIVIGNAVKCARQDAPSSMTRSRSEQAFVAGVLVVWLRAP